MANIPDLKAFIVENSTDETNISLCAKITLFQVLKMPKKSENADEQQKYDDLITDLLSEESHLEIRLQTCRALIAKGDNLGFKSLITMIKHILTLENSEPLQKQFANVYGAVITRGLSKKWIVKERGYHNLSRFSDQRLYKQV